MTVHNGGSGGGDADHSSIVVLRCRHLSHKYFLMSQFVKTIIFKQPVKELRENNILIKRHI